MLIKKILNNNVAVVVNETNEEMIVMGRGITFKKVNGDYILKENVDKIYKLASTDNYKDIQDLFLNVPIEIIEVADNIVSYANKILGKELKESTYIFIADHINESIKRYKVGISINNGLLWEIKRFYKIHFEIGLHGINLIKKRLDIELPDDEAGFIALHIADAELGDEVADIQKITVIIHEITNIVSYYFGKKFDEDSVFFYRFIMHLKFFAQRLLQKKEYSSDSEDLDLFNIVKNKYSKSYECVEKITYFIENQYNYSVNIDEKMYLTIHIERIANR